MRNATLPDVDIVLVGGGHAHVHVLSAFAMHPEPGVGMTLITRDLETPYSGMLPGVVRGLYTSEEAHIDLVRLAAATGARLIHAEAIGLDRDAKRVILEGRPPIGYDLVSIDVGITPALSLIEGAAEHGIAVKPIGSFLRKFDELRAKCAQPGGPRRIAVLGGGAGGVELLLSLRARLLEEARTRAEDSSAFSFALVTEGEILDAHNARVRTSFRRALATRGIELREHSRVTRLTAHAIELADGSVIESDAVLIATQGAAPRWFGQTGLKLDSGGFLAVGPSLQTLDDPDVFGAGDCVALVETPRAKAGVYAVRSGPPLANNLRRRARGQAPKRWVPQKRHLALISLGGRCAVASRGWFKAEGDWVWTLKDWIDRRWMRMYQDVERMRARMPAHQTQRGILPASMTDGMRCGGCAAKIGPGPLSRVLARLAPASVNSAGVVVGLQSPDDAAVIVPPNGKHIVQTVDFFRAFVDDPYVFGEIAANHALNDIFAMGGEPRYALTNAVVPPGAAAKVEEALYQLLAGARACLDREGVALIGGHSSEGADLALGLSVSGEVTPDRIVRKSGLKPGDALVLTRPLGTGILFAAAMRAQAKAASVAATLTEMRLSNRIAAAVLLAHGATAMTDVTGFGLAGHLGEMLVASGADAMIDLASIPLYDDVSALEGGGIRSSLLPENLALAGLIDGTCHASIPTILFDPQTSGGLLAGIPEERVAACVSALRSAGYASATIIGRVGNEGLAAHEVKIRIVGHPVARDLECA